jgi:hypothetical protein
MTTRPPAYEPEEYPRCERCGRLALHSRATMCSVCFINKKEPPPPSPLSHFTASDFTTVPPAKK